MRNQSLLLTAPRHLEWVSEDLSPLQPHEVLVQTTSGAISIGSELPLYRGTARSPEPIRYPRMTGYESLGVIIDRGSAVQHLNIGDRVVAFYGHRTQGIISETKAIPVPGDISDALALLVILTCDVTKGIRKVSPQPYNPILITGAGTIGLLTVFMLKAQGMQAIDVVEPCIERQTLALELGARMTMRPEEMSSGKERYPIAFECSSHNAAFELLQARMQQNGRICILSDGNLEPLVVAPAFHEKELMIVGSSDGWDYQEHAKWYFNLVRKHPSHLEQIFDYHITSDELTATFERLAIGAMTSTKVLVHYKQNAMEL